MKILHYNRSYRWIFVLFMVSIVAIILTPRNVLSDKFNLASLVMPVFGGLLVVSQLVSGVALDGSWKATVLRSDRKYWWMMAWQIVVMLFLVLIALGVFRDSG